jgi:hypothetical protein
LEEKGKEIALDYSNRGGYDSKVVQIRVPRADFDKYFREHVSDYDRQPNGQIGVPNTLFDRLNKYPRSLVER